MSFSLSLSEGLSLNVEVLFSSYIPSMLAQSEFTEGGRIGSNLELRSGHFFCVKESQRLHQEAPGLVGRRLEGEDRELERREFCAQTRCCGGPGRKGAPG